MQTSLKRSVSTEPTASQRDWVSGSISLIALLFIAALAVYQVKAPDAVSASAPATEFSSARAMNHLQVIAQKPHATGTAEIAEVRTYILQELKAMGLTADVQKATVIRGDPRSSLSGGAVNNIVAQLPGSDNGKAVMLVAHYDTVPMAKGASDDGAGVAALLETARALRAGPTPKSRILFLFTDGEEAGLLGAKAFVEADPWAKEVKLLFNFEARGSRGPSIMFETSDDNGWLIEEFAKVAPYPIANSASYDIYKRLPNDTDFTVFKRAGLTGYNFAYIDGSPDYHSPQDSLASIDERSLQHHGSYALALARHFANLDFSEGKRGNAVYFNFIGPTLIHYSGNLRLLFVALTSLAFAAAVIIGFRRKLLTRRGLVFAGIGFLFSLILAVVLVSACWWLIRKLPANSMVMGDPAHSAFYRIGFIALTLAIVSAIYVWLQRRIKLPDLLAGTLFAWLLLMVAVSLYLPGLSYLFTWPLLFVVLGAVYLFLTDGQQPLSTRGLMVMSLCAIPAVILFAQMIHLLFVALTVAVAGVPAALVALVSGLLIVPFYPTFKRAGWWVPATALALGLLLLIGASLMSGANPSHPKRNTVLYAMDADQGKAVWATNDAGLDEWTSQFFNGQVERGTLAGFIPSRFPMQFLKADAAVAPLSPPLVSLVEDQRKDDLRTLRLRVASTRQAPMLSVYLPNGVEVVNALVDGKQDEERTSSARTPAGRAWSLHYYGPPQEGVDLTLQVRSLDPLKLTVVDRSYRLPQIPGQSFTERPAYMIPSPVSDLTLVSKSFTF